MNFILFDNRSRIDLLPLTFTRPIADLRVGILTIREKWEKYFGQPTSTLTEGYLSKKFPANYESDNLLINASVCPDAELLKAIFDLDNGQSLRKDELLIALRLKESAAREFEIEKAGSLSRKEYSEEVTAIQKLWDIFSKDGEELEKDFQLLTAGRKSAQLSDSNTVIGSGQIFLEESAVAECAVFNTNSGPIYIGKDAEVMEGSVIRGPFALCEHSAIKMGARIYGPTTVGPYTKVGGEVNNTVFIGYSNKGHDGFLGNAVIGEWVNIGADSNNSNLKNNYDEVKLWNYGAECFERTGLQFCGLIMGDHTKCAINTMFNTGTVVGVSANVFGAGFPHNFIPSFAWGGANGFSEYKFEKAMETAGRVMKRRGQRLEQTDMEILQTVFDLTKKYRKN